MSACENFPFLLGHFLAIGSMQTLVYDATMFSRTPEYSRGLIGITLDIPGGFKGL